jgi:catechol 2,3-dioxygenase-like lactoylglutathione lyase family enzyme
MITGLAHLCFTVSNLEKSVAFYRDILGLTPAFDYIDENGHWYGQYMHVGERNFIELFEGKLGQPAEGQAYRHFCLEVDDIHAMVKTLRERGLDVTDVKTGKDRSFQAWIADPDGNRIELHCYTPESKQKGWVK